MIDIIVTFYDMEGVPREESFAYADKIFNALDKDGDGTLDEDEFCKGCLLDPDFSRVIRCSVERIKDVQELKCAGVEVL